MNAIAKTPARHAAAAMAVPTLAAAGSAQAALFNVDHGSAELVSS